MEKQPKVTWHSERQKHVAVAAGYRIVDGRLEVLERRGHPEEDSAHHVIVAVRPSSLAEQTMWSLLMEGENNWTASPN